MKFNIGLMFKKLNGQLAKLEARLRFMDISYLTMTLSVLINKGVQSRQMHSSSIASLHAWKDFNNAKMDICLSELFTKTRLSKTGEFIEWLIFTQGVSCKDAFHKLENIAAWIEYAAVMHEETEESQETSSNAEKVNTTAQTPQLVLKIDTTNSKTTVRGVNKRRKKRTLDQEDDFTIEDIENSNISVPSYEYDPNETPMQEGRTAYAPISINSAYSRGYCYYPVQTVLCEREHDKEGKEKLIEHIEVVCVRSDRTIQRVLKSDLPDGANAHQRIFRLTDGTLISSLPKPSDYSTWSWSSISEFINNESTIDPLDEMLYVMHDHLRSRVWLPTEADYWLLTLIAAASYCQTIFDAVPLVLLNGPAGSGKSEISAAMVEISANSVMLGTVSASTMIRAIDAASGLCVLDDLEAIGVGRGNKKGNFSEIAQMIKVSYKKDSATKMVTNTSTGRQEVLNFYGIKIISATLVPDSILASRMLYVHTKHMNKEEQADFANRECFDDEVISCLVDKMHTWVFSNVISIRKKYDELFSSKSNRDDEISAPLKVLAALSGDETIISNLDLALANQTRRKNKESAPEDVLIEIAEDLVLEGFYTPSVFQIMMELRKALDPGYSINYAKETPGWSKPEWIGRILRGKGLVKDKDVRKRLYGSNLRAIAFKQSFIDKVLAKNNTVKSSPKEIFHFCKDCSACPYALYSCEIKPKKQAKVA